MKTLYYVKANLPYAARQNCDVLFFRTLEEREEPLITVLEAFTDSLNLDPEHWQNELDLLLNDNEADGIASFIRSEGYKAEVISIEFPIHSTDAITNLWIADSQWRGVFHLIEDVVRNTTYTGWFKE